MLTIAVAIATAHHAEKHIEHTEDTESEPPEEQGDTNDQPDTLQSRHHIAPSTVQQAQTIPVLIPYPYTALRSQPAYPTQQLQYVPVYQEFPTARHVGGGVNANIGSVR